jgi:hypothetical protein
MASLLEKQIDAELKKIDPDLYLDKHLFEGHIFWTVRFRGLEGEEPYYVAAAPELSWHLVSQVRMNEGDITEAIQRVKTNNFVKKEEAKKELHQKMDEAAAEHNQSTGKLRRWFIPGGKPIA